MTPSPRTPEPVEYRIRVAGHLDDHWATWLNGLVLRRDNDGTTTLTGPVADQAQMHGLLARIRDLGVTLISLDVHPANHAPPAAKDRPDRSDVPPPWPADSPAQPGAEDDRRET